MLIDEAEHKRGEAELGQDPASQALAPLYVAYALLCLRHRRKALGSRFSFEEREYFSVANDLRVKTLALGPFLWES